MKIINESDIKKYYKTFGYVNLIFSILLVCFLPEIDLKERIITLIMTNVVYHVLYFFFSNLPKDSNRMNNNFNKIAITGMLKGCAILGLVCSLIMIYFFISNAISQNEYIGLFAICIPIGLFLGAYSLWTDLNNE